MTQSIASCPYCGAAGVVTTRYSSFKHWWYFCRTCRNVRREQKRSYPLDWLLNMLSGGRLARKIRDRLLPDYIRRTTVESDNYADYGSYFDLIISGEQGTGFTEVKRQRYFQEPQEILDRFREAGIDLADKSILDVSGGPGTFAHLIKHLVRSISVSEYDERTVVAMRSRLPGVDVFKADLNEPWPVSQQYDVLLYRSCLVFCKDLGEHIRSAVGSIAPGGHIYIYSANPSLGNTLRWQYEDYTFNAAYDQVYVRSLLEGAGLEVVADGRSEEYRHYLRWFSFREALPLLWGVWNAALPGRPRGLDARAFWLIARKSPEREGEQTA